MLDLLTLTTDDWTLRIRCKDVVKPREQLKRTLKARGQELPASTLKLSPVISVEVNDEKFPDGKVVLPQPIFFENRQYDFEFDFTGNEITEQSLHHRLKTVEDSFFQSKNLLRGNINTGNDIGWFRLRMTYKRAGKPIEQSISFEVLPTKMDMQKNLEEILGVIDEQYPLWRFSLAQKTELEMSQSSMPHEKFPLLWLAHFTALRDELEKSVKQVINTPHSRLLPFTRSIPADRLKSRIGHRLEQQVAEDLEVGEYHRRYALTVRRLSIDTPENRFVKMVLERSVRMLSRIAALAKQNDESPDKQPPQLSKSFFDQLSSWQKPLEQYLSRPFFREIGDFNGLNRESLVLHQKAGYAGVYRIWQQLKQYLDVLGSSTSISMKTIAELYEVWCLLEIRQILIELGFEEKTSKKAYLNDKALVKTLKDGIGAAFTLVRGEVEIKLSHEPVFNSPDQNRKHGIYSWITSQKPDILLEARFNNGTYIRWIFDAKYRIASEDNTQGKELIDYAPDDAINQMHRYRDALIHLDKSGANSGSKSRPILGAYVLYPGFFDEENDEHFYRKAIDEIGIGAFPLLPGEPNKWLRDFFVSKLGENSVTADYKKSDPDRFYVEESARIPYHGMDVSRQRNLSLLFTGPVKGRSAHYRELQQGGKLGWYHTRVHATERQGIEAHIIREARFLAIPEDYDAKPQIIRHIYPINSVSLAKRSSIDAIKSGISDPDNPDALYWLFELGVAFQLPLILEQHSLEHFEILQTGLSAITAAKAWDDLPSYYKELY